MRRIGIWLAGILAVALAATLTSAGQARASVPSQQNGFEIWGEIDTLYPGVDAVLDARVTNPQPFTIRVQSLTASARDASPECPAGLVRIGSLRAAVDVPPGATGTVPLEVQMDPAAPDACQGVAWPLEFVATATDVPGEALSPGAGATHTPTWRRGIGSLAYTGAAIAALVALAAALVTVGVLLRRVARRRAA